MDLSESAQVIEVLAVHYAGEQPFCLEDRLINLEAVPEAIGDHFDEVALAPG